MKANLTVRKFNGPYKTETGINLIFDDLAPTKEAKVKVQCPNINCMQWRTVAYGTALCIVKGRLFGYCNICGPDKSSKTKLGKFKKVEDQVLPNGSIIHWSERDSTSGYKQNINVTCNGCNNKRSITNTIYKFHSDKNPFTGLCYKCSRPTSSESPGWKGGKIYDGERYLMIHPSYLTDDEKELFVSMMDSRGYIKEHRLVMARHLNRPLMREESVHHINEIKTDNRIENLELTTPSEHGKHHFAKTKDLNARIEYLESLLKLNNIHYQ